MSSNSFRYKLTPQALEDLDDVWRYSAEKWSIDQADRYIDELTRLFETLSLMPTMAREREEFEPSVRILTHERHIVVYRIAADHILIIRILGGSQNWTLILNDLDNQ